MIMQAQKNVMLFENEKVPFIRVGFEVDGQGHEPKMFVSWMSRVRGGKVTSLFGEKMSREYQEIGGKFCKNERRKRATFFS